LTINGIVAKILIGTKISATLFSIFGTKACFEGRHPAPHFDIDFFIHTAGRGHPDIRIVLYEA